MMLLSGRVGLIRSQLSGHATQIWRTLSLTLDGEFVTTIPAVVVDSAHSVLVGEIKPPSWPHCHMAFVPQLCEPDGFEPGSSCRGWQDEAASRIEEMRRDMWIMPRLTESERTMLRSQSGPGAGLCLSAVASSCDALRIASHLFQALLLRRLRLLPSSSLKHLLLWLSSRPFWRPSCSV